MKTLRSPILLAVIALSLALTPALPRAAASNSLSTPPTAETFEPPGAAASQDPFKAAQDFVNKLFSDLFKNVVIPFANQVGQWLNDANDAASKTVSDFTSCPSPAAQNLYNDLKTKRDRLRQTIDAATAADNRAKAARTDCKNNPLMANFKYMCDAAYTAQPFAGQKNSAQTALNAVNGALASLQNLKCISGCNKTGKLVYPTASLEPGGTLNLNQAAQATIDTIQADSLASVAAARGRATNGRVEANVCTAWDNGGFGVNLDAVGSADFSRMVGYEAPHCSRTERVSVCTNWDMTVLLPKLKELKIVPPDVKPPDVSLDVPNKTVRMFSGITQANCTTPVKVCTSITGSLTLNFNAGGNPLQFLDDITCAQETTIGCSNPPFGLTAAYANITVPDLANARIRVSPGRVRATEIKVDLTRPEFNLACAGRDVQLPLPPRVKMGTQTLNLSFVCIEPRWVNVVANR